MKKELLIFLSLTILIIGVTGCVKNYSRSDIKRFVRKQYNMRHVEVSKTYEEVNIYMDPDYDNYTHKLWTITDKKNDLTFHILDHYEYSNEYTHNNLISDYYESLYLKYRSEYGNFKNITIEKDTFFEVMNDINLSCTFKDKSGIDECFNELKMIDSNFRKDYSNFDLGYCVVSADEYIAKHPIAMICGRTIDILEVSDDKYDELLHEYYEFGYAYKIDDILNEMTDNDINNLLERSSTYRLYKIDANNNILKKYNDIIGNGRGGLSYSALYYLLKDEDFNPIGTKDDFKFNDKYGNTYEFSNDFNDYVYTDKEGKKQKGYYYIKNGNKVLNYYRDLNIREIENLFDIKLKLLANCYNDTEIIDGKFK